MDIRLQQHNTHLENPSAFEQTDPHLRKLKQMPYLYKSALLEQLPENTPGIFTLGGGRQIGKTTLLKQWMQKLLASGVPPTAIYFLSGEIIDNHHSLIELIQRVLPSEEKLFYLLIDEITYVKHWERGIKFLADAGVFENTCVMLTGSDLNLMKEARMSFPGRRGKASKIDFHFYPLSFRDYIHLIEPEKEEVYLSGQETEVLHQHFLSYLQHGGYITAINDMAQHGQISLSTFMTYSDWIRGDVAKRNKSENTLHELISALIKRYGSQLTWHNLAKDLSIEHHNTVADYIELLVSMDALYIQQALIEDKLLGAPKKARKVYFTDPFIYHACSLWISKENKPSTAINTALSSASICSALVEACAVTHLRRFYPTYYIKAEGEVDIAYIKNNQFWPIEIKWTNQLHTKDLKQIKKYANSCIWAKQQAGMLDHIKIERLPQALLGLPYDPTR